MLLTILRAVISAFQSQRALAMENLALRHQPAVLQRTAKNPRVRRTDRALWGLLSRFWPEWRESLTIVQPETVIRWHRERLRLSWRRRSRRGRPGRPKVIPEIRNLIRKMSEANSLWSAPRIHGELLKLGIQVSQAAFRSEAVEGTGHRRVPVRF
jgi:putative transposase